MMLTCSRVKLSDDDPQERQRDVEDNDDHGPQVSQEQQHHEPGQAAPAAPSTPTLDGPIDDWRPVELHETLTSSGMTAWPRGS
jgi:hypothetical protein